MTYVMSDIHGNAIRFNSIMAQIDLQPEDTLYVLGDVIDRYPDGIRILRLLMDAPNVKMLLGNHEEMMLRALDSDTEDSRIHDEDIRHWYRNGGDVTHAYLKHIRKSVRREIFDYLRSLPVNIDIKVNGEAYKLVHGAPVEQYADHWFRYESPEEFAVWYRMKYIEPEIKGVTIIFGHTPTERYQENKPLEIWHSTEGGRIGIDCGSGYPMYGAVSGRLACLRLDDMKVFYSEDETIEEGEDHAQ